MIANGFLALCGLILITLSLGVYLSNPKKAVNRALTAFLFSGFLWVLANFLTNIAATQESALIFARATLIGGALSPLTFLIFVSTYTGYKKISYKYLLKISLLPLLLIGFTSTPLNVVSADVHGRSIVAGPAYLLLVTVLLGYYTYGIRVLIKFYKKAPAIEKSRLQYIFAGLIFTIVPAFITNVILPVLGSSESSAYGSASVVAISVFTTIAIVRHKLLDIRLVVARSLAYVLVLGTLASIFTAAIVTITSLFFSDIKVSLGLKITYAVIALLLTFIFQPLKRFFDRVTNSLFYRDAYDPQELLNDLNRSLVTTIDLEELLGKSAEIIASALKTENCTFAIREAEERSFRYVGGPPGHFKDQAVQQAALATSHLKNKIIVSAELESESHTLQNLLQTANIAILVKLQGRTQGHVQHPGYILLGQKQSGGLYSPQDVKVLEIIADELVIAIQNSLRFEEISRFNITLQQKVEQATKELRRINAKLKALDEAKDEFISMASHQLRTPLTTIKGYLSMILDGDVGVVKKNQKEMIQHAFDSSQRMVYIIADLLNVSRMQTGKFAIENTPTNLAEVIVGEIEQLKNQAHGKKIELIYKKPDKFPVLNLDENKVRQVVMNFLDNALHYTPNGGKIEVTLSSTDDSISYTVSDTGVGVPKDAQHNLFTKFYRADNARKMRPDGTGLGLFMAKKVVVAQGGAIIFKSTEGKGSTFGFTFPRKGMETTAEPIAKKP